MMVTDNAYAEHPVFEELDGYIDFYRSLATSVFSFSTMGTTAICNMDTYVYSSIQGTLESIRDILRNGRINDAYALLRKYYDSAIINVYSTLFLQDHFSIENFIVRKINDWLHGKEKLPEYRVMSSYIKGSQKLATLNAQLYGDEKYKEIRNRCNDHTHYNFFGNLLLNDRDVYIKSRKQAISAFSGDIRDIFILHLAYVFLLNDHYMISGDYIDALDCGGTPEYWVAPFIQETFDNVLVKARPDIVAIIKNITGMHLS